MFTQGDLGSHKDTPITSWDTPCHVPPGIVKRCVALSINRLSSVVSCLNIMSWINEAGADIKQQHVCASTKTGSFMKKQCSLHIGQGTGNAEYLTSPVRLCSTTFSTPPLSLRAQKVSQPAQSRDHCMLRLRPSDRLRPGLRVAAARRLCRSCRSSALPVGGWCSLARTVDIMAPHIPP